MKMELLERLYKTHSPSFKEQEMIALVENELRRMKIDYEIDHHGQIYAISCGAPLICAHMDQVQRDRCHKVLAIKNRIYGFDDKGNLTGLGADDKNGIFIALAMIEKFRDELSFIFTCGEEAGGQLSALTPHLDLDTDIAPYGLIFDRKGNSDIIGTSNSYCCEDLETAIQVVGREFAYRPARGIFSDADELSRWIPCVNLSCGYYEAHTKFEYTKPAELWSAMRLAEQLITHLPKKGAPYEQPEQIDYYTKWQTTHEWYDDHNYKWDDHGYPIQSTATSATSGKNTSKPKTKSNSKPNTTLSKEEIIEIQEDYSLAIEDGAVYLYDSELEETFIAETIEESIGTWDVADIFPPRKLMVNTQKKTGKLFAFIDGVQIRVEEVDTLGNYITITTPFAEEA